MKWYYAQYFTDNGSGVLYCKMVAENKADVKTELRKEYKNVHILSIREVPSPIVRRVANACDN